ncbi:MAG: hypothetical protein RLZZ500_1922 [Bacteroidota bacterium]|jgi:hypothetical protein
MSQKNFRLKKTENNGADLLSFRCKLALKKFKGYN